MATFYALVPCGGEHVLGLLKLGCLMPAAWSQAWSSSTEHRPPRVGTRGQWGVS